jgi:hypothetical protein
MKQDEDLSQVERNIQFETVYKRLIPQLDNHGGKIIATQLMLILQLEGVIGATLSKKDIELLEKLKEKLLQDKKMCQEFVDIIEKLKNK